MRIWLKRNCSEKVLTTPLCTLMIWSQTQTSATSSRWDNKTRTEAIFRNPVFKEWSLVASQRIPSNSLTHPTTLVLWKVRLWWVWLWISEAKGIATYWATHWRAKLVNRIWARTSLAGTSWVQSLVATTWLAQSKRKTLRQKTIPS